MTVPAGREGQPNYHRERVERLLSELRYELERGWMEGKLDETLGFEFVLPVSKSIPNGGVVFQLRSRPVTREGLLAHGPVEPKLRVIK